MVSNYIPDLSFVAELNGEIVGHFLFSRFLSTQIIFTSMCQETYKGSLVGIQGYVVYDMYYNA